MKNDFNFCPNCGNKNIKNIDNIKWKCPDCDFTLYSNVAAAVGIVIKDKYNNVLFELRAKEPRKGFACLPGGFVNRDETAEDAIIRECREEIGFEVENVRYLCTRPNTYPYKNIEYKTCDIFFMADLPAKYNSLEDFINILKAQEGEVLGFVFYKVENLQDIDKIPLAFQSARETLKEVVGLNKML